MMIPVFQQLVFVGLATVLKARIGYTYVHVLRVVPKRLRLRLKGAA